MPGMRCAVAICNNSYMGSKKHNVPISFHSFPKGRALRDIWVKACRRADSWNSTTSYICSAHFKNEDFEVDLRSRLMNIPTKRKLKKSAIPSIFLEKSEAGVNVNRLRKDCVERCENERIVTDVVQTFDDIVTETEADLEEPEKEDTLKEKYSKLLDENKLLKQKCQKLAETKKLLEKKKKQEIEKLK